MHVNDLDLNLLRLFDAVYRARNVSRAAEMLDMTQPAASQGLTRLRLFLGDPLFMRAPGGVQPTPRAERLAGTVRHALSGIEKALSESSAFEPGRATRSFRIHMSDIGEGRFLPDLMASLRDQAPNIRVETLPLPRSEITAALDSGRIDFALGFLPMVKETRQLQLLHDKYIVLLRRDHPFAKRRKTGKALLAALRELEFVAVRSHVETLRVLQALKLEDRVRLVTEHFMVLPPIVKATDLAVVMPRNIGKGFALPGGYAIVEPPLPSLDFAVSLHWSSRFESDLGNSWLRQLITSLFGE